MIQLLISNGHSYHAITEDYTPEEVGLFVTACLKREEAELHRTAIAGRAAQADKEGWKNFLKVTNQNIDKLSQGKKGSQQSVKDFHSRILNLPSMAKVREEKRKARAEGREPDITAAMNAQTVQVHKGFRHRPPEPVLPKEIRRIPPDKR